MVKKVKTYLNNAEIIEDENRLMEIANQCEPGNYNSFFLWKVELENITEFNLEFEGYE